MDKVISIENSCYPFPWTKRIFSDCIKANNICKICEINGNIIGYLIMYVAVAEAHILNVCVKKDMQGKGLGASLMDEAMENAVRLNADTAFLEVRVSNAKAIELYSLYDFVEVGQRPNYYPAENGREDAIVMAKHISPMVFNGI